MHLMIDIETLATAPSATVLSVGAVRFDADVIYDKMHWVLSRPDQERDGRTVSMDTQAWWAKQGDDARKLLERVNTEEAIPYSKMLLELKRALSPYARDIKVWGNGAGFDVPILEDMYRAIGQAPPWKFWNIRCYRTMKALFGIEDGLDRAGTYHDALDDALFQAGCLQTYLRNHATLVQGFHAMRESDRQAELAAKYPTEAPNANA